MPAGGAKYVKSMLHLWKRSNDRKQSQPF